MEDAGHRIVGVVPAYVKSHSYGEYVFDHGWAQAIERAGGRYYPKLQVSVPFTPATGPRLPGRTPGIDAADIRRTLIAGLKAVAENRDLSSVHATFLEDQDRAAFEEAGWLIRIGCQYHWQNDGYGTFDDFLRALSSRKRKDIRKERRQIAIPTSKLVTLTGGDFEAPSTGTCSIASISTPRTTKWGFALSHADFFQQHRPHDGGQDRADHGAAAWAVGGELPRYRPAGLRRALPTATGAAALRLPIPAFRDLLLPGDRALHIAHRLKRVEAGAQGEHKIQRGYLPVQMESARSPDRASWIARRDCPFPGAGARRDARPDGHARRTFAL